MIVRPPKTETNEPAIALLPWGNVIEDFLDMIGISFERFCQEMTGGWLFGYIEALKQVGIRSVLICVSINVDKPTRYWHQPTGATIWALPAPALYRVIRHRMKNPYGTTVQATFGKGKGIHLALVRDIAPYLATPIKSLSNVLQQENCSAILCQEYEYARFDICVWLGRRLALPVYASFQGGDFQLSRIEKRVRRSSMKACKGVIVASQRESERIKELYALPNEKIAQIFNPLDLSVWQGGDGTAKRQQLGISPEAQVVVWHGRIDIHRKGLDVLLEAWDQVTQQRPDRDLHLLLVGTGQDAARFRQQIDRQQPSNLHWIDEYILDRTELRDYLYAANLYVLPSRHEGFAVAPLEAMACRLPVVATDVPGVADIFEAAAGGLIVPSENASMMAAAIGRVLDSAQLRQTLSESAYLRVQSAFSTAAVGRQLRGYMLSAA